MTVITTSTSSTATAYSNQRKIDRCSNGVLWAVHWDGAAQVWRTYYSQDNGATWVTPGYLNIPGTTYTTNGSFFIDVDDYAHFVYKSPNDGYIYYRRGTPNAGRTAWTWSAPTVVQSGETGANYPDVVAHREGTGWAAHITYSWVGSGANNRAYYHKVTISNTGTVTMGTQTDLTTDAFVAVHTYPSIDFNHIGDGKTIQGGTPHLYVAWSAGATGAGKGIRFKKATYSAGTWTWGTEREIDSTRYRPTDQWLNCLYDGTRVVIGGQCYDTNDDVVLYERDAADTTTTTRILLSGPGTSEMMYSGSMSYDNQGNVYLFGVNSAGPIGSRELVYRKWTRSGDSLGPEVVIESTANLSPFVSVKRGYSNNRLEFIYTDGTASPYNITYDSILLNELPNAPTDVAIGPVQGTNLPLTWTHNDPDDNPQNSYKIRWRKVV